MMLYPIFKIGHTKLIYFNSLWIKVKPNEQSLRYLIRFVKQLYLARFFLAALFLIFEGFGEEESGGFFLGSHRPRNILPSIDCRFFIA
jgi:hypothetical protein